MLTGKTSTFRAMVFLVTMTLGLSASGAAAKDSTAPVTKQQVKALIKTAKTPEDHQKLARYYWYEADKLKSEAKEHQETEEDYEQNPSGHPIPKWPTLGQHCKDLSASYQKAAEQAEQLAKAHEEMAKSAAQ
jgi:hypothetical protein